MRSTRMGGDPIGTAKDEGGPGSGAGAAGPTPPKRNFASRVFGYDVFLSFALGPPPRGTHRRQRILAETQLARSIEDGEALLSLARHYALRGSPRLPHRKEQGPRRAPHNSL